MDREGGCGERERDRENISQNVEDKGQTGRTVSTQGWVLEEKQKQPAPCREVSAALIA